MQIIGVVMSKAVKQTVKTLYGEDLTANSLAVQQIIERESPLHFTVLNEFYFVKSGTANFKIGQEDFVAKDYSIIFVPTLVPYSFKLSQDAVVWRLAVSERYMSDFYECYPNKSLPCLMNDSLFNVKIYSYVFKEFDSPKLTELEKIACVTYVLAKFSAHYPVEEKVTTGDSQIAELIRYIYKNYEQDITLDSLAQEFCVSKMVLSRKISKYIGVDLRKFISDVRIQAYLKMRGDKRYASLSSVELAYKCGFKSYETFYRAYKRRNGE